MRISFNNYGEKWARLKPHDSEQQSKVSTYDLKSFLGIFYNSSGVFLLETSLTVSSDVHYHTLMQVAREYRFHYDKTEKVVGSYSCKTMLVRTLHSSRKTVFLILILMLSATRCIVPAWLETTCINVVLCGTCWLKKCLIASRW